MRKEFLSLVITLISYLSINAQENEIKLWSTIEYGINFNEKWSLDLSQQLRLKENLTVVDNHITQTEAHYKTANHWKISTQMRYYYYNNNKGGTLEVENMFRYRLGLEKKFKLKPGNLEFRGAYQNRFSLDREDKTNKAWRFRPLFEWKIKNWAYDPKFYFEYIEEVGGDQQQSYRYGVESKIKFSDSQGLSVLYFYQKATYTQGLDAFSHVLSLKYVFKNTKKEEKNKEGNK